MKILIVLNFLLHFFEISADNKQLNKLYGELGVGVDSRFNDGFGPILFTTWIPDNLF